MAWRFIDDQPIEAEAIAASFARAEPRVDVEVMSPSDARANLLDGTDRPDGLLIDVYLGHIPGERGSGPGIAQDIRIGQKAGRVPEYPLVRFAGRDPVIRNIGGDPASDDLFDLKIQKEVASRDVSSAAKMLVGLGEIYQRISQSELRSDEEVLELIGISGEQAEAWCHRAFVGRMRAARSAAVHVAASALLRGFILPDGLLISEDLLAARLGVVGSGDAWNVLLGELEGYVYQGVGGAAFPRWWARGVENWFGASTGNDRALTSLTIGDRVGALSALIGAQLHPYVMPHGSAGERPWARCTLHSELDPPEFVAVDPAKGVRIRLVQDIPVWQDPLYASLGAAVRQVADYRIDLDSLSMAKRSVGVP